MNSPGTGTRRVAALAMVGTVLLAGACGGKSPAVPAAGSVAAGLDTIDDLKGRTIGTVTGYVWEKSIKAIDGAQTKVYQDAATFFSDLGTGRIDVGFIDPLLVTYQAQLNPNTKFKLVYFTPPTDEQIAAKPDFRDFRQIQIAFYVAKQAPKL